MGIETDKNHQFKLSLGDEVNLLEQEARMILPGIQALLGFQFVAVFNASFKTHLTPTEQYLHLAALILVAISSILVAAPAAYHRQARHHISEHFIRVGSRFLTWALLPFALGTTLDIYIVARYITDSESVAIAVGAFMFSLYAAIWFFYPHLKGRKVGKLPVRNL